MPPGRQERQRRRKITLACEPCRERKARCDGGKPICSTCQRRSLNLEHCVYTVNNARTACSDDYTKTLHERIHKLEQACASRGIDINTLEAIGQDIQGPADNDSSAAASRDFNVLDAASAMETSDDQAAAAAQLPSPYSSVGVDSLSEARRVTAMGTILAEDDLEDSPNNSAEPDFYGRSSAVAFLKEAYSAMNSNSVPARAQPSGGTPFRVSQQALPSVSTPSSLYADFDKFLLPPRPFADHLLQLYFQRVHYLYPVFHKPAFERAYESLWQPTTTTATAAAATQADDDFRGVGLGCSPGADATTIVFHSALNSIFALACNFADLTCAEKAKSIEIFLLRSRKCLSVDLLEKNNLGVVQTLLLSGLVFQGTPFPDRCWNAVGIACRIAQGLGLHMDVVAAREEGFTLEMDVRQRTWQGCVILDTLVSMTFGRPTVTSNLSANELRSRSHSAADQRIEQPKLEFITQSFKLSLILENILSQVYQPWRNRHPTQRASCGTRGGGGEGGGLSFDAIVELDSKLTDFEDSVPPLLSWGAELLYLRLMLHRPILTDLSAGYARPHRDAAGRTSEAPPKPQDKGLRAPFLTECARVCVGAAMRLIDLVQGSYWTDTTGAWWWNSLYACAAGLVLIVSRLCPRLWTGLDHAATSASWEQCQGILQAIAVFSVSARKSLDLLRKIDGAVTQLQAAREPLGEQIDPEMSCAGLAESWSLPADIDVSLLLEPDPMSFFRGWEVMGYET
ncbi:fungal-specific transcription factor domain-containing protein [Colletotrichum phormii]|uniref:Fungal-specific transcription factor domain-containing protein n=1 Tax=Colletotrichum phormii TaxID=359342 RepID=A0AAI9ZYB0_9PEZI|nr:fungal-specific transcription factor domain-containing protein [Colletotrichum phormii]KAK1639089.1 fungal-specific transcription factor domain-containing protein [Colletotrichum phormii]